MIPGSVSRKDAKYAKNAKSEDEDEIEGDSACPTGFQRTAISRAGLRHPLAPLRGNWKGVKLCLVWRLPFAAGFHAGAPGVAGAIRGFVVSARSWLSNTPGGSGSSRKLSGLLPPPYYRRLNVFRPNLSFQGVWPMPEGPPFPAAM